MQEYRRRTRTSQSSCQTAISNTEQVFSYYKWLGSLCYRKQLHSAGPFLGHSCSSPQNNIMLTGKYGDNSTMVCRGRLIIKDSNQHLDWSFWNRLCDKVSKWVKITKLQKSGENGCHPETSTDVEWIGRTFFKVGWTHISYFYKLS